MLMKKVLKKKCNNKKTAAVQLLPLIQKIGLYLNENGSNKFVGYDDLEAETKVVKIQESKSKRKRSVTRLFWK